MDASMALFTCTTDCTENKSIEPYFQTTRMVIKYFTTSYNPPCIRGDVKHKQINSIRPVILMSPSV